MPRGERNAEKDHCRNGHAYDADNTVTLPKDTPKGWARGCRQCMRARDARRRLDPDYRRRETERKRSLRLAIRARREAERLAGAAPALERPDRAWPINHARSMACALAEPPPDDGKRPIRGAAYTGGAGDVDVPFLPLAVL